MNHYSLKPLRLDLRPSRLLASVLGVATLAALVLILLLPFPFWITLPLCVLLLGAAFFHIMRDAGLRLSSSILALEVASHGQVRYLSRREGWREVAVRGDSYVTPWLTVVNLSDPGKRWSRAAILMSDSGDAEMFRRLRVWLRWGSQAFPEEK